MLTDALGRFERTLDVQVEWLDSLDTKAQRVAQYTTVFLGIVFTGLSVVARLEAVRLSDVGALTAAVFFTGVGLTLFAVVLGYLTYLSSVLEYGPDRDFGYAVADGDLSDLEYREALLVSYAEAVRENKRVLDRNACRFRDTLTALLSGLLLLSLSGFLFASTLPWTVDLVALCVGVVAALYVTWYIHGEEYLVLERQLSTDESSP